MQIPGNGWLVSTLKTTKARRKILFFLEERFRKPSRNKKIIQKASPVTGPKTTMQALGSSAACIARPGPNVAAAMNRLGLSRSFFFFILKKNQNFKNICLFRKISKIYPGHPMGGRQALNVIFFFKFATRSLAGGARVQGGLVAPQRATGGGLSPPFRATDGPRLQARQGACRPSLGRPGLAPYISVLPLFPPNLSQKIPPKI